MIGLGGKLVNKFILRFNDNKYLKISEKNEDIHGVFRRE